jgi:hypothetical protein
MGDNLDKEDRDILKHISEMLDKILAVLIKPPNKFARTSEFIATVVTILGIIGIVDVIKNWFFGG